MTDGNYPSRELVPLVSKGESENNEDETEEKLENKAEHTLRWVTDLWTLYMYIPEFSQSRILE